MNKTHDSGAQMGGLPRFDDGMADISELIRAMAQALVNEVMGARADEACAGGN